jgi:hypothetical protein
MVVSSCTLTQFLSKMYTVVRWPWGIISEQCCILKLPCSSASLVRIFILRRLEAKVQNNPLNEYSRKCLDVQVPDYTLP